MSDSKIYIDVGSTVTVSAESLIQHGLTILGTRGGGKSNSAAVIAEGLLSFGVPVVVVDVVGEWYSLKGISDKLITVGKSTYGDIDIKISGNHIDKIKSLVDSTYLNGVSVVLDVSSMSENNRQLAVMAWLTRVWELSSAHRIPTVILLEEAQNWIPERSTSDTKKLIDRIASEGRKRGLSLVVVTQRPQKVDKNTISQSGIYLLHKVTFPNDMKVYCDIIPKQRKIVKNMVSDLKTGEALIVKGGNVYRCKIKLRSSKHVGYTPTLADIPTNNNFSIPDLIGSKYD